MRQALMAVVLIAGVSASGCIIETSEDSWCNTHGCYSVGASCDFYNDQDCFNRTQAWWCNPSDGRVYLNDCISQCTGLAPYACCGYDPSRGDDACLCCMSADCSGLACHI